MEELQFEIGEVVFAKLTGFPWWPGYIKDIKKNGKFEVYYLSDFTKSYLPMTRIRKYTPKDLKNLREFDYQTAVENANIIIKGKCTFNQLIQLFENGEIV